MSAKYLYVLRTEPAKYYYVGVTDCVGQRVKSHNKGEGCAWTKHILATGCTLVLEKRCKLEHPLQEDYVTKQLMMLHGIEYVRGGTYSQVQLCDWQIKTLEEEFKHARGQCFKCKAGGHYANECPYVLPVTQQADARPENKPAVVQPVVNVDIKPNSSNPTIANPTLLCNTCGISGHTDSNCSAKQNAYGVWILWEGDNVLKGKQGPIPECYIKPQKCTQCGIIMRGHNRANCQAVQTASGAWILWHNNEWITGKIDKLYCERVCSQCGIKGHSKQYCKAVEIHPGYWVLRDGKGDVVQGKRPQKPDTVTIKSPSP